MDDSSAPTFAVVAAGVCLLVPPAAAAVGGDVLTVYPGRVLLGLLFVPPFLLGHVAGWRGAAAALAGGLLSAGVAALLGGTAFPGGWPLAGLLTLVALGVGGSAGLLHRSRLEAEERALADPGTGLPNRRHGLLHLERAFAAARRGTLLTVVVFDLDHFKRVNDQHGHATGDEVLRQFARVLEERTRDMNLSARMGGEEFVSILEDCDIEGARVFAESVRTGLADVHFPFGTVTTSAGIAAYEDGMASPDVLLAAADQALYRAKSAGRDRVDVARGSAGRDAAGAPPIPRSSLDDDRDRPGAGELVLVVDDDDDARRSVARVLRRSGFDVIETGDPDRALRIVRGLDAPPDVVITDVIMPAMSGFRMVELLTGAVGPLRVLYMSGYVKDEVEWSGAPGAVTAYLGKPVTLDELRRAVNGLLDRDVGAVDGASAPGEAEEATGTAAARDAPWTGPQEWTDRDDAPEQEEPPVLVTGTGERPVRALLVRLRHLGYENLVARPLAQLRTEPPPPGMRAVVAWLEGPVDDALEEVVELRARLDGKQAVPLLLLAEKLPAEVTGRWPDLFPALYLPTDTGLGELDLQLRHLFSTQERMAEQRTALADMEARIEAGTAELESAYRDLLVRLARASEMKDDATGRHAERVAEVSRALALEMGLGPDRAEVIGQAAALHDIGKIAIPDAILDKPGDLTPTERELVERHTVIGADLLHGSRHPILREAERMARSHHERWDGSGYPEGLAGEEIPLGARIVSVADVFDVVTHARSYLEASSTERALSVVEEGRGTYFDPSVVSALVALDRRGELPSDPDRGPVATPDASPRSPIEVQSLLEELDWS